MSLYMGQFTVATGTVPTIALPSGTYNMTVYNTTGTTLWLALGTSPTVAPPLTINNGLAMHSIPTSWNGYQAQKGGTLWALNTGSAAAFNYILSTQQ